MDSMFAPSHNDDKHHNSSIRLVRMSALEQLLSTSLGIMNLYSDLKSHVSGATILTKIKTITPVEVHILKLSVMKEYS